MATSVKWSGDTRLKRAVECRSGDVVELSASKSVVLLTQPRDKGDTPRATGFSGVVLVPSPVSAWKFGELVKVYDGDEVRVLEAKVELFQ